MSKKIVPIIALLSITSIYAADKFKDGMVMKGFTPKHKTPVPSKTMRDRSKISEQILRDEIQACTLPVVRERMQETMRGIEPNKEGARCRSITYLTIKRMFDPASTDDLSKTIFDKVRRKESKPGFVAEQRVLTDNDKGYIIGLATPNTLDMFTNYKKVPHADGTYAIECTTLLDSDSYIEEIIADIKQKN